MKGLPQFTGAPIDLRFEPQLSIARGKLFTDGITGTSVHAASFLKQREMVLETSLLSDAKEFRRILIHELFHFAWWRLGNLRRNEWDSVLQSEFDVRARGELGWSSEWRKVALHLSDPKLRSKKWREYACESFCDSVSCYFVDQHPEFTLAGRFRVRRMAWIARLISEGPLSI